MRRLFVSFVVVLASCGSNPNNVPDSAVADAPVAIDARVIDGSAIDALPDAFVALDAAPDAFVALDAAPDAFVPPPDAAPDAFVPPPDAPAPPPDAFVPPPDAPAPPDAPRLDAPLPTDAPRIDAPLPPDAGVPVGDTRIRLVAANISSGNNQAYEGPGIRIFEGLHPDVVMLQEFNFQSGSIRGFVDQTFGPQFSFARGAGSQQIPNGVISRYPILESGEWVDTEVDNRAFVWARIDIPGPIDLFAISVHLLTRNAPTRNTEASLLVQHIHELPATAYVVLGGDFNTDARTEAAVQTLSSVLVTAAPYPADLNNQSNTNASRNKPYDWVLASPSLDTLETDTVIGTHHFPAGFVADTRVYNPIADLAPALTSDSDASMMQHMAVVRDFNLPGTAAPAIHVTAPNGGEVWQAGTAHQVTWSSTSVTTVKVELLVGGMALTLSGSTPAVDGQLTFTVPAIASTTALVRVTAVTGSAGDTSDAPFTITIAPPPVARVFVNEVLANEPGSDTAGEFIELVNSGGSDVDLSGWTLSDAVSVRHTFAAGTTLAAGRAIVVFGDSAGIPAGLANAVPSSTHTLALSNGGDTVTLANSGGTVDTLSYTTTQPDGVSLNRASDGDPTAGFVLHNTVSTAASSPGKRADGSPF